MIKTVVAATVAAFGRFSARIGLAFLLLWTLFWCSLTAHASEPDPNGWSAPVSLGSGVSPKFSLDFRKNLVLTFDRDEKLYQSRLQENGSWSEPLLIASTTSGNEFMAYDGAGVLHAAKCLNGGIAISLQQAEGTWSKPEQIVAGKKKSTTDILHFSIDAAGTKHLLFSSTKHFEYGADYPGSDVYYKKQVGGDWEKELLVSKDMSICRTFEVPGIAVAPNGGVFVCSYNQLYSLSGKGGFNQVACPVHDFGMPVRVAAGEGGTLHFIHHSFAEDGNYDSDTLKYICLRPDGTWCGASKIGPQYAERVPDLFLASSTSLFAAWEDTEGNILVSKKRLE